MEMALKVQVREGEWEPHHSSRPSEENPADVTRRREQETHEATTCPKSQSNFQISRLSG